MDSSNARRLARQASPIAESLEGRQLLSTATTTPATAPSAQFAGSQARSDFGTMSRFGRFDRMALVGQHGGHLMSGVVMPSSNVAGQAMGGRAGHQLRSTRVTLPASPTTVAPVDPSTSTTTTPVTSTTATTATAMPALSSAMPTSLPSSAPTWQGGSQGFAGSMPMRMMSRGGPGGGSGGDFGRFGRGGYGSVLTPAAGMTSTATTTNTTQAAFEALRADEQAVADKSVVTPVLKATLRADLSAIRKAATSAPDATKLQALDTDLKAVEGAIPTAAQLATISADYTAVLNSEGVTDTTLITKTLADAQAIVTASNVTAGDLTKLAADRKAAGLPDSLGSEMSTHDIALASLLGVDRGIERMTPGAPDLPSMTGSTTPANSATTPMATTSATAGQS